MKQDYQNKRIVVIGAGKSGQALVRYLVDRGAAVALSDMRSPEQIKGLEDLQGLSVRYDLGGHSLNLFEQADMIAVSPGVPLDCEPLLRAQSCNIPLLGEIEIASRELSAPIIAVTGTNGKSTTTSLIGQIMQAWGKKTFVGGNLGSPLVNACSTAVESIVVELSSFQLETIEQFHPAIGILLNLSSDHLDRYPSQESYYQAKMQLFRNMTAEDFAVLNADDLDVCRLSDSINATKVWFSSRGRLVQGMTRLGDKLVWNWDGAEIRLSLAQLQLSGEHNIENAMAAMIPALLQGCPAALAWTAVCSFAGLEHRMQLVRKLNGVAWYNDSKGTNVGSVVKSLAGLGNEVTLIAGGKDKGGDFAPLRPLLEKKVAHLILIGEAAQRMATELSGACDIRFAADLAAAVQQAHEISNFGGTVLLSPACSSFDMFANFEERGYAFERLVQQLPEKSVAS
ncbi:MAG: UDP-N-acetylmuramoyl-L-alanine--D-glutamate ligase [Deltaproteobacteria bacterium]|nr:UDP-N-acetylmuramoyl-L-alanine--D-glutamate ligase [Deltaproteobacteria bacterium]